MTVEDLLDWAMATLREADSALPTKTIVDRLTGQFHAAVDRLEVLLSLDRRFVRDPNGNWQLGSPGLEASSSDLVRQAIMLRERAIETLVDERQALKDKLERVQQRLGEIDNDLLRLEYRATNVADRPRVYHEGDYSLE